MQASVERDAGMADRDESARVGRWRESLRALVSTYRTATSLPLVVLAASGVVLTPLGWWLAGAIFLPSPPRTASPHVERDRQLFAQWPGFHEPGERWHLGVWLARHLAVEGPPVMVAVPAAEGAPSDGEVVEITRPSVPLGYRAPEDPVVAVPYRLASPAIRLFDRTLRWGEFLFYLAGGAWTLVVWALMGGGICRLAALRIGRDQRIGLREAAVFAQRRWLGLIGGAGLPLLAIVLLGFPVMILGLLAKLDFGLLLAAILFPLVLLAGLLMTILALGLLFGWPLMWGTIGAEGSDSFDAISRSYAYTYQCPVRYLIYAAIGAVIGVLGWLVTWLVAAAVVAFSQWALAWGMGAGREATLEGWMVDASQAPPMAGWAVLLFHFYLGLVWLAASAVAYSHFWCLATAIYLLLRRDADEAELDDIYQDQERDEAFGLPAEDGAEAVADEVDDSGPAVTVPAEPPPSDASDSPEPSGRAAGEEPGSADAT